MHGPHAAELRQRLDLAASSVGNTPIVQLPPGALGRASPTAIKKEGANPTGSIKDRACISILRELIDTGGVDDQTVLVDASSGNFGTSLAYFASVVGLRSYVFSGERLTAEKRADMRLNDALVELKGTDTSAALAFAREAAERPHHVLVDQLHRAANVDAHTDGTAPEILRQVPDVDTVVCSAGSGGTALGLIRGFERLQGPDAPSVLVVYAADLGAAMPGVGAFDHEVRPPFVAGLFDSRPAVMVPVTRDETLAIGAELMAAERAVGSQLSGFQTAALAAGARNAERERDLGKLVLVSGDAWHKDRSTRPPGPPGACGAPPG